MTEATDDEFAHTLARANAGDPHANDTLFEYLYESMRTRASRLMRGQPTDHTFHTTVLVNETLLRLMNWSNRDWKSRADIERIAAAVMRRILVDHARKKKRFKRQPGGRRLELDQVLAAYEARSHDLAALDEALERLEKFDPEMVRAVELRFFAGLTVEETAQHLGMPKRTFEKHWQAARAWLLAQIHE